MPVATITQPGPFAQSLIAEVMQQKQAEPCTRSACLFLRTLTVAVQ